MAEDSGKKLVMSNYAKIAALGSSFAAGPGIPPVVDRRAGRSGNNYAHVLATMIDAQLVDLTVSGATTKTILDVRQRTGFTTLPPQITLLPADCDIVTVTAGGNDLHYVGSALKLGLYFEMNGRTRGLVRKLAAPPEPEVSEFERASAVAGLVRIVEESRRRVPNARIVLVDYLPIFGAATRPLVDAPLDAASINALRRMGDEVSGVFVEAARVTGADLAQASEAGRGHELGAAEPWVQPMQPLRRLAGSFHPNAHGMKAVAAKVFALLG